MKTSIGKYDPETGTVPVKFTHGGVVHRRAVNACRNADGAYDAAATKMRVAEVASGVQHKIEMGVLS